MKKAAVNILMLIVFGIILSICLYNKTGKILYKEIEDGYEITIYDKWNQIIKNDYSPVEPGTFELNDSIIGIEISTGNPASYIYYFDKKNIKISKTYFNPILINAKYIAYMEDGDLIITDLFNEGLFYKKVVRNFTETADPSSAIIDIEMPDGESFIIKYYKGEEYQEEIEVLIVNETVVPECI